MKTEPIRKGDTIKGKIVLARIAELEAIASKSKELNNLRTLVQEVEELIPGWEGDDWTLIHDDFFGPNAANFILEALGIDLDELANNEQTLDQAACEAIRNTPEEKRTGWPYKYSYHDLDRNYFNWIKAIADLQEYFKPVNFRGTVYWLFVRRPDEDDED
jgi:hypothetical protein